MNIEYTHIVESDDATFYAALIDGTLHYKDIWEVDGILTQGNFSIDCSARTVEEFYFEEGYKITKIELEFEGN